MTESPEELAAVEQLLAESDALRGWLARLAQAPGGVPDVVRERVRSDYQHRLDQVTSGLRAHAEVIAAKLRDDHSEHAALQARAASAREALAEAELRYAVGEYDGERFEGERRRHSSDTETFQVSLDAVAERIARLEEIHALVQRAPRLPASDIEPVMSAPFESAVLPFAVAEPELVAIDDLAPDADPTLAVLDEPVIARHEAPLADSPLAPVPETGPLSFRPSGGEPLRPAVTPPTRPRPFESAPPLGIPAADIPPRFVRPGERFSAQPAPPATAPIVSEHAPADPSPTGDNGAARDAGTAPAGRTLRCGECGAMNRPLEWYCEKCGAELTAV